MFQKFASLCSTKMFEEVWGGKKKMVKCLLVSFPPRCRSLQVKRSLKQAVHSHPSVVSLNDSSKYQYISSYKKYIIWTPLCFHIDCVQTGCECLQPRFNKAWVTGFPDYRAAKWPSVRDVHRLQTYRDSPSIFLESSVSFKNTFRAPLGKEKAPLVFPSK